MADQNDVYQIKLTGTLLGQLYNNVFWYRLKTIDTEYPNPSNLLLARFLGVGWQPFMEGIMPALEIDLVECINWANLDDYASEVSSANDGQYVGGESMPSAICLTFSSAKPTPGKFYSYKRVGGVPEQRVAGNTITDTTTPTYAPFADFLSDNIDVPATTLVWEPVQVKHSQTTAPYSKTDPYKMPIMGSGNPIVNRVLNGPWSWKLGTQNSRKPGYGD